MLECQPTDPLKISCKVLWVGIVGDVELAILLYNGFLVPVLCFHPKEIKIMLLIWFTKLI